MAEAHDPMLGVALRVGQQVHAYSKRWTPAGWEPDRELATVVDPCVSNDPVYDGDVEIQIEGVVGRTFVPRASLRPVHIPAYLVWIVSPGHGAGVNAAFGDSAEAREWADNGCGGALDVGETAVVKRVDFEDGLALAVPGAGDAAHG